MDKGSGKSLIFIGEINRYLPEDNRTLEIFRNLTAIKLRKLLSYQKENVPK